MKRARENSVSFSNVCEFCGVAGTRKCTSCLAVYYCCKAHQKLHWPVHKQLCKENKKNVLPGTPLSTNINQCGTSGSVFSSSGNLSQTNLSRNINEINRPSTSGMTVPSSDNWSQSNKPRNINEDINQPCTSSSTVLSSPDSQSQSNINEQIHKLAIPSKSINLNITTVNKAAYCASFEDICKKIIRDLNKIGVCKLDEFVGSDNGNLILEEVLNLYSAGKFEKGKISDPSRNYSGENVRGDLVVWLNSNDPNFPHIGNLWKKIDAIILACNAMPDNGILSNYTLQKRTKTMVACYPGNGAFYRKHVDNPLKDGRCITCVYYLNKNWDVKKHGGMLRLYPAAYNPQVCDIEPIFDRLVLFWSDKRNPHEVYPAFVDRFAVTVWYFDIVERNTAVENFRRSLKS